MKLTFTCQSLGAIALSRPLLFTWNPDDGTVAGPDAPLVREMATWGHVNAHPMPWSWRLSAEPLKSWVDMAAIVGSEWVLPAELIPHYPKIPKINLVPTDENGDPMAGYAE